MKCLLVIDMQPYFKTTSDKTSLHKNIIEKIGEFNPKKDLIVFVEYGVHSGKKTYSCITDAAEHFKHKITITKYSDNGAPAFDKDVWEKYHKKIKEIYVCGVNTDCCVYATVWGLSKRHSDMIIKVIPSCCNSFSKKDDAIGTIKRLRRENKNIKIVKKIA